MKAYQVYNGMEEVGHPFTTFLEGLAFAKMNNYNLNVIEVNVEKGDRVRLGNKIYLLTPGDRVKRG